jgi:hypothetical protein
MNQSPDPAADLTARREREDRRAYARRPKRIADVLAQLIAKKGYGRPEANAALEAAWRSAAGEPLASASRPGKVSRGKLEVTVTNSTTIQELGFAKRRILAQLEKLLPDARIRDIRCRVGPIQ